MKNEMNGGTKRRLKTEAEAKYKRREDRVEWKEMDGKKECRRG